MEQEALLSVRGLKTHFKTPEGTVKAIDGIDFDLFSGETLGIVGESGSGKTMTSLSILGLLPKPQGNIVAGSILYGGKDLTKLSEREMRSLRGKEIAMIFQEPMTSLNPVYTVEQQIIEAIQSHSAVNKQNAAAEVVRLLEKVGIPEAKRRSKSYPHELSGGMRQRVMIAMALACNPKILIADEPTTALDVTIQAQILELLTSLQKQLGMSIMIITHDMGVIADVATRVVVLYAGKVVETASTKELFANPLHPYTLGLLACIPKIDEDKERLYSIPGMVPSPLELPAGCRFSNRCGFADETCRQNEPELRSFGNDHKAACRYVEKIQEGTIR